MRRVHRVSKREAEAIYVAAYHEQIHELYGGNVPEFIAPDVRQELSDAAWLMLTRQQRRALGDRGYTHGLGAFAPSLKAARRG